MKFVHIADMHFDSPFINLADKENLGEKRRLEQRKIFKKVIEYIKENISNSSIIALFKGENVTDEKLNNSIVKSFLDKNIKERTIRLYNKIEENKLRIITREEKDFPKIRRENI